MILFVIGLWAVMSVAAIAETHPPTEHDEPVPEPIQVEDSHNPDPIDTDHDDPAQHPVHVIGQAPSGESDYSEGHQAGAPIVPASGHSHWGEDGASTPFERSMARLGTFHATLVHFPIALILAAALAQLMVLSGRFQQGQSTVGFLVWTGAIGGLAAGLLGWAHSGPVGVDEAGVMLAHRLIGSGLMFALFAVVWLFEWHRRVGSKLSSRAFNGALFLAASTVAINGFLGGALAHGGLRHLISGG
jgi:uncharacterized membrane protein